MFNSVKVWIRFWRWLSRIQETTSITIWVHLLSNTPQMLHWGSALVIGHLLPGDFPEGLVVVWSYFLLFHVSFALSIPKHLTTLFKRRLFCLHQFNQWTNIIYHQKLMGLLMLLFERCPSKRFTFLSLHWSKYFMFLWWRGWICCPLPCKLISLKWNIGLEKIRDWFTYFCRCQDCHEK